MGSPALFTARDVARRFGVSPRTIYAWVDQGLLRPTRVGTKLIRFTEEDVQTFLRRSAPEAS